MPQLDTSTWFITILSTIITLFVLMQLKISTINFPLSPSIKSTELVKTDNPWETKWTKIYSPLSLLPQ
uniref:ATP synthase complex subunit 8 n=1 Tax=Peromyscus leucopus TaxID=10041 RepID=A0A343UJ94_PERLE|nr:ATP synthase F0 subunit 8 [Peromyscus leucopus]AYU71346.1 ATP synthase F0 subunit 8 [Peromyscus leucopus]